MMNLVNTNWWEQKNRINMAKTKVTNVDKTRILHDITLRDCTHYGISVIQKFTISISTSYTQHNGYTTVRYVL